MVATLTKTYMLGVYILRFST